MIIGPYFWMSFLLVFVRIVTYMLTVPIFSGRQIPSMAKIGLSFLLAVLCSSVQGENVGLGDITEGTYILILLKEICVGIALGLVTALLFYAIQLAGTLIDLQVGFSMASLFDPDSGMSMNLTGRFKNLLAILVLLSTNGHHLLLQGILVSFDWIPLQSFVPAFTDGRISTFLVQIMTKMFTIAFMIGAPIMGTLFILDAALGIVAKTVPQINIFVIGVPVKIAANFFVYLFVLPSFFYMLNILLETMYGSLSAMLKIMGA